MIAEHRISVLATIGREANALALTAEKVGEPFLAYLLRMVEEEAVTLLGKERRAVSIVSEGGIEELEPQPAL